MAGKGVFPILSIPRSENGGLDGIVKYSTLRKLRDEIETVLRQFTMPNNGQGLAYVIPYAPVGLPTSGQVLQWNGTNYVPVAVSSLAGSISHAGLTHLDWAGSGHTGPANRLAGFDSGGASLSFSVDGSGGPTIATTRVVDVLLPGLCPTLSGNSGDVLHGDGTWAPP